MVWESNSSFRCECGLFNQWVPRASLRNLLLENCEPGFELLESAWRQSVETYSVLDLTYPEDRLPALSGIANLFGKHLHCEYLAGLWQSFLPHHLLWMIKVSPKSSHRGFQVVRARPYRALTWPWVSLDIIRASDRRSDFSAGSISFRKLLEARDESQEARLKAAYDHRFKILDAWCNILGHNPYGRVSSGQLNVQGAYIVPTRITRYFGPYGADENCHLHFDNTDRTVLFASDILWDAEKSPAESLPAATDLICLSVCHPSENMSGGDCLVLMPSKESLGKFERVGVMFSPKEVDLFQDAHEGIFEVS